LVAGNWWWQYVDIGIVHFDTEGHYEGRYSPLNEDNTALNPELVADLKALKTMPDDASVIKYNIGWTNFDDGLDKAIEYFTPTINPTRGDITITLDLTHDKGFVLDFFDVTSGGTIVLKDIDGEYVGGMIEFEKTAGMQSITLSGVHGVYQIVATLFGPGALAQMNVCRNPAYTAA
jgi:hypothetical protein